MPQPRGIRAMIARAINLECMDRLSLEEALEFIAEDELVEALPTQILLCKILLKDCSDWLRTDRCKRPK
jgi:predicted membrane GTPase involved in stress response